MNFRHVSLLRNGTRLPSRLRRALVAGVLSALGAAVTANAQVAVEPAENVVVNLADLRLSKKVTIDAAKLARVGPVSRLQITITNTGASPVDVQYAAQWMDEDGFEIPSNTRWEPIRIDSNMSTNINLLGNSRDISSVVVNVKPQ